MSGRSFVRRLGVVPEPAMREALWRETFSDSAPHEVFERVAEVLAAIPSRSEHSQLAFLSLARFLQRHRDDARRILMPVATAEGHAEILSMLVEENPLKKPGPGELAPPRLSEDREITLGERRSWARRHDRDLLARLLADPDPMVITNLMRNPRIIEADVLRIVSRRPNSAAILTEVFQHPRWGRRPQIRLSLVLNPYTPLEISVGLLGLLNRSELRQVGQEQSIHPILRGQARGRLRRFEEERRAAETPAASDGS